MEGYTQTAFYLPLRLGATARSTLQEFIDIDVTAEDLVQLLHKNQAYRDLFARFVSQKTKPKQKSEEKEAPQDPTHRLVSLLGMLGSRNLILSLRMHKAVHGRFPVQEDGSVEIKASDYLKRAMEMEESFLRMKLEYSETAYAAAVYFDWINLLLQRDPSYKQLEPFLDKTWKRAVRSGLIAYFLAREIPRIGPKPALAAGILLQGGKLLLAAKHPSYPEFETAQDENAKLTPLARMLLERQKFGASQEEVGSHSLRYFDVFSHLIPAIRYYREPYCLKGTDAFQYELACLLYLADAMARSWKLPANDKDPVFREWEHPSVKSLRLKPATLIQVMKSAMTSR